MSRERDFIARLAGFARDPAARGLLDDAAVLRSNAGWLVLTHDMIVEGVHYLPDDPPADVAWKLVAVNLSDLAAKGARPLGVLVGYPLARDAAWDAAFADGLAAALDRFAVPLLGGDTVSAGEGARMLGLTAIGAAEVEPPSRSGARTGDHLYVTGHIGTAGLGLSVAKGTRSGPAEWLTSYRRPVPRLAEGRALAGQVHAMCDVSDGLLIDARRLGEASGLAVTIDLDAVPLPPGASQDRAARLAAVTAGDDYELLFAAPPGLTLIGRDLVPITPVGRFAPGSGLELVDRGGAVPLPTRLGYEHGST